MSPHPGGTLAGAKDGWGFPHPSEAAADPTGFLLSRAQLGQLGEAIEQIN